MKKCYLFILTSVALLMYKPANAQYNLAFSRAISIDTSIYTNWNGGNPPNPCTIVQTVPADRVWKVEFASMTEGGQANAYFFVNGVSIPVTTLANMPMWLPAGSTLQQCISCCGGCGGCNFTSNIVVSIVEFILQSP